ncbi:GNAT family N-acetyltransferase [Marinoscillum sp.]|uniref:GNAT family N-acetyltransferase n=1 Tax=Marinoscillum sp. TaxID=2024838 RepID=UPI003BA96991
MTTIELIEVTQKEHVSQFLNLPNAIYATDKNWIRPLDKDIEYVFDPTKNSFHTHGIITRWIAMCGLTCVGRVAAFVNFRTSSSFKQPTGGMGFFECINSQEVAFKLFDTCKSWLEQYHIQAMDGPINFGENNAWWGLVVEGYEPPLYRNNYNPTYYKEFFEAYGFKTYFEQYYYTFDFKKGLAPRYYEFGKRLAQREEFHCENVDLSNIRRYAEDFRTVYNRGWQTHDNFKEMSSKRAISLFKTMKPVIDKDLIWFLYHHNQPVGFIIMIPELNRLLRNFRNGKFGLKEKLQLKVGLTMKMCKVAYGSVIGFVPEFQNKGLEALLFYHIHEKLVPEGKYETLKIGWAGDFNPRVVNLYRKLGFKRVQTAVTYRFLFDSSMAFERAPIIN